MTTEGKEEYIFGGIHFPQRNNQYNEIFIGYVRNLLEVINLKRLEAWIYCDFNF